MPQYQLNIIFEQDDLPTLLEASEKVTIIKQSNGNSKIAWVTFSPFLHNNVKWETNYSLYCSNSEIQSGTIINKLSDIAASSGLIYNFSKGVFCNPYADNTMPANSYGLKNNMSEYKNLVFGLAQDVVVNNLAEPNHPISAVSVPYAHTTTFTPYETIEVFLEANISNSMIITNTKSNSIQLKYGGDITEITLKYNKATGEFYKIQI